MRARQRTGPKRSRPTPRALGNGVTAADGVGYIGFAVGDQSFYVGDFVYLKTPSPAIPPYVALLEHVFIRTAEAPPQRLQCEVRWFYRPEDTAAGRQPEHGENELFESFHRDINFVESIEDHCAVLTELEFARYVKEQRRRELCGVPGPPVIPGDRDHELDASDVYFCRRGYNPKRSRFFALSPDQSLFAALPSAPTPGI